MRAYGVEFISPELRHGDAYTGNDAKKNPKRKKSRSYNNPTSKRVFRAAKKKERRKARQIFTDFQDTLKTNESCNYILE